MVCSGLQIKQWVKMSHSAMYKKNDKKNLKKLLQKYTLMALKNDLDIRFLDNFGTNRKLFNIRSILTPIPRSTEAMAGRVDDRRIVRVNLR